MKLGNLPPFFEMVKSSGEVERLLHLMGYQGRAYRYLAVYTCFDETPERAYGLNEWHVDAPLYWLKTPKKISKNGLMDYQDEIEELREKLLYQLEYGYHYENRFYYKRTFFDEDGDDFRSEQIEYSLPSGLVMYEVKPPFIGTVTGTYALADLLIEDLSCIAKLLGCKRVDKISTFHNTC